MDNQLGTILKETRLQQHLSQQAVATGICAQSMLSAIENGQTMPNAKLLIHLCQRLQISLNDITLAADFAVSGRDNFNAHVSTLCRQHEYRQLRDYLNGEAVLSAIETADQTQAYYYYLGVTDYQLGSLTAAQQNFRLALASAATKRPTALTRLCYGSLGLVAAQETQRQTATTAIQAALAYLDETPYEENLNCLFYLAAFAHEKLGDSAIAATYLNQGIAFASEHNSHYMLANDYHLLAILSTQVETATTPLMAKQYETMLTTLFHEKVYDDET
ncbi:MAG: helix-turn-helix domain-containing protein [Levilactobacillus sp.]|jgi:transcriptional regulator with XRE-family HTH domain|uniref:helix-turn-helix domain-containing protein n=1 Tax=Levilactobacillus sp. TaxID=2767919 RepID=UPI00258CB566|nr:helix-turn-helix transcriptional regulator [Levilactobacillus sp.]MCH4123419.1 helix-turn-helix domain-containing protein [Levilactobacillus sp.]MCI1552443.1 helix-turn-helix domain-containing protein [Levilactobacillus sp.]MCI1599030.1 helix-turn-helix domain-containing protein [Levilactobacillus sp.]MCI1606054.1 helix-turn-helix domain-containing protein [Levilactobacillus sp.]